MPEHHPRNNIGYRAKSADSYFFSFELLRCSDPFAGHDRAVKSINRNADDLEIYARERRLDLRRQIGGRELNTAGHHRLIHQRAAADVDALRIEPVFFEDLLVAHNFKQIMGNADTAIPDLHGFQLF